MYAGRPADIVDDDSPWKIIRILRIFLDNKDIY